MTEPKAIHRSVLLQEAIDSLDIHPGEIFVDGTFGGGGHSREVLRRFGDKVRVIGIDADEIATDLPVTLVQGNFRNIDKILDGLKIEKVDKILLDIGMSSDQFESGRGFSFQKDEPLVMSFSKNAQLTAKDIVNKWEEENIATILQAYGEESFARKIARAIVENRPIETTSQLVNVILKATPAWYHHRKIHPATKTFQALRIVVNDEIQSLKEGIRKGFERLKKNGRIAVISFHSIEDRAVKQFFKEKEDTEEGRRINKKVIVPSDSEIKSNPRSRSAKLRILERI